MQLVTKHSILVHLPNNVHSLDSAFENVSNKGELQVKIQRSFSLWEFGYMAHSTIENRCSMLHKVYQSKNPCFSEC